MTDQNHRRFALLNGAIPWALVLAVVVQTVLVVRWLSGIEATVFNQTTAITEIKSQIAALTAANIISTPLPSVNAARITALEQRVKTLEERVDFIQREQAARSPYIPRQRQ